MFSKGFSADHILSLVPGVVDETVVYCETLQRLALDGSLFHLDTTTLRFTIDVIGKAILCVSELLTLAGEVLWSNV